MTTNDSNRTATIAYRKNYKYQLAEDYIFKLPIRDVSVGNGFVKLFSNGMVRVAAGYAWDGASGPTMDDETNMRAALEHDAGYQLLRNGLDHIYRETIDRHFRKTLRADGCPRVRAWYYYRAVKAWGGRLARKGRKVHHSPRRRWKEMTDGESYLDS